MDCRNMKLKIALLQLLPGGSLEEQLNIGKTACIKARERIVFKLVNYEANRELLKSVPHVSILSVQCRC